MRPFQNLWGVNHIHSSVHIGAYVEIGDDVEIGEGTRIQAFVFIPPGVRIGKRVFIAPRVTFTNDKSPRVGGTGWEKENTFVEDDAVIGAGVVVLPGLTIGKGAFIGAGSVVTKDVPAGETWYGNPARPRGRNILDTQD